MESIVLESAVKERVQQAGDYQKESEPDWKTMLLSDEVGQQEDGTKFVLIKGLRRLAKIKGVAKESHQFGNAFEWETQKRGNVPFVQMGYSVTFKDGSTWSDVADAHIYNIPDVNFAVYPTAIAATRAEARTLRKALGIDLVSKEELGAKDSGYDMTGQAKPQQITLIKREMKKKDIKGVKELFDKVGIAEVTTLDELSFKNAQSIIKWLNDDAESNGQNKE